MRVRGGDEYLDFVYDLLDNKAYMHAGMKLKNSFHRSLTIREPGIRTAIPPDTSLESSTNLRISVPCSKPRKRKLVYPA